MKMANDNIVLIEGWHINDINWPHSQLCTVKNGKVTIENTINDIITLGIDRKREPCSDNLWQEHKREHQSEGRLRTC